MSAIFTVASNTFRENRRDRVLYVLLFFALLLIVAGLAVGELTPFEQTRVLLDVGLAAMTLMGSLISIFLGTGLVSREIDRRTVYVIISKPVTRTQFLLGKILGLVTTLTAAIVLMAAMLFAISLAYGARPGVALAEAVALAWVEQVMLIVVAVTFATFTTTTLAAMFSLGTWVIGMALNELKLISEHAPSAFTRALLGGLWWVLPDFSVLDMRTRAAYGILLPATDFLLAAAYGLAWVGALTCVSSVIFSRRDFR